MREGETQEWKTEKVSNLACMIKDYPVVGILNMATFPSRQLLLAKKALKETAVIRMSKKSIIRRALEKAGRKELVEHIRGQPALILSTENPFKLSKFIIENKSPAPAKEGSECPKDIMIPAGETPFTPGPIIGELQKMGVDAKIEGGKVVVGSDSIIAKEGEILSKAQADLLGKLGIEPLEIGLDLLAAYEDGMVYGKAILAISTEQTILDMQSAYTGAFNLAFNISYTMPENIDLFIQKAFREAKAVATEANYTCSATIKSLLAKASAQANALQAKMPEAPVEPAEEKAEEPKEEKTEEKPAEGEEKKEETPAEEAKPEEAAEEKPAEEEAPKEEAPAEEEKKEVPKEEKAEGAPEEKPEESK